MPEWRKELSERVREVQEKRAREAAREAAEAERQRLEAAIDPPALKIFELYAQSFQLSELCREVCQSHRVCNAIT